MTLRELSPELAEVAKQQLGESADTRDECLKLLKEWIHTQPYLNARLDDQWLVAFLRFAKYSLERAKQRLDIFYTMRSTAEEMAQGVDLKRPEMSHLMSTGVCYSLEETVSAGGPRIVVMKPGAFDINKVALDDIFRLGHILSCLTIMNDDSSTVAGQICLVDLADASMDLYWHMTPTNVKKLISMGQDILPLRLKGTHYINVPPKAETVFKLMKMFLTEKNKSRFHIHTKIETLYEHIPKNILPKEYGGDAGPVQDIVDRQKKKLEDSADWVINDQKYRTDESLRPEKKNALSETFGTDGSFRKLNVD